MRLGTLAIIVLLTACENSHQEVKQPEPSSYREAIELIHAYSGSGDELKRARELASDLHQARPGDGYAEALVAEAVSTWEIDQDGSPADMATFAVQSADEAIRLNPRLALPHLAKARVFIRTGRHGDAANEIAVANQREPGNDTGIFLRADLMRRVGNFHEAEEGYRKFIQLTPAAARKSNGYHWLGQAYVESSEQDPRNIESDIANAKLAYAEMVRLDPTAPWKAEDFAKFLNDEGHDYAAAEQYAKKALSIRDFQEARQQLAVAQYLQLFTRMKAMDDRQVAAEAGKIEQATGQSIDDAIDCPCFSDHVYEDLSAVKNSLDRINKEPKKTDGGN